jgi:hypothetical protein
MKDVTKIAALKIAALSFAALLLGNPAYAAPPVPVQSVAFSLVPSGGKACFKAKARVHANVQSVGPFEVLQLAGEGLPPNTAFSVFIIQVPTAPFGLSWYQGDFDTNSQGEAQASFTGRFQRGTFILAPNSAPAPEVFPDNAATNPPTPPVQLYHIGIWFSSPGDAANAGCPATQTPFTSNHQAGIQALNTSNFEDTQGPLFFLNPP